MKQLYGARIFNGVGFSKNGKKAFLRGEKPRCMWNDGGILQETTFHHIEIGQPPNVKRKLVMFYKKINA